LRTRASFTKIARCSFVSPLSDSHRWDTSSHPTTSLPVASGRYCLLFTSGVHRLLGPCEGRQSWRRPNETQSATSNCNTHDPVTRRLHRQHLVHPRFVKAWVSQSLTAKPRNLLFSHMGPRGARSGSEPWGPPPTPWPTAAPGDAGRGGGALPRPYELVITCVRLG
jgi:hypothetical protein